MARPAAVSTVVVPPALVTPIISGDARTHLGEMLLSDRALKPERLAEALNVQTQSGEKLGAILVKQGALDANALTIALAKQLGLPTVDLRKQVPTPEALALVPETIAREFGIVPLLLTDGQLYVAIADGSDLGVRAALQRLPVKEVVVYLASADDVATSLNTYYRLLTDSDDDGRDHRETTAMRQEAEAEAMADVADRSPVVQLVNRIITQALRDRASDIHVEPQEGRFRVRFRIDGAMREMLSISPETGPKLINRIKIMADMDIAERRRPQDGQFEMTIEGIDVDVRVAAGATIWGETAVLRLLDKSRSMKKLSELGMSPTALDLYLPIARKPYGMILCSGPTGSGKTTTLYATLAEVSRDELNVMTIEDPVEYVVPGVNQMQINAQADVTFAGGLKSILRQDPDVILVGEIRDQETATIAVRAALTGHLVLSSVHATDASSALYRMIDIGVEPFLVASSLIGVIGQRLVRRICPSCTAPYEPTPEERGWYDSLGGVAKKSFVHGVGCNYCSNTGYRDRIGVYEVLVVTKEIRRLMISFASPEEMRTLAIKQGMRTMSVEAMALVANDLTTIDEVMRKVHFT